MKKIYLFIYQKYYENLKLKIKRQHYNIEIKDLRQPLLLHRAKKTRQEPGNGNGNGKAKLDIVCLIPELCFVTGLSTNMKDDFSVKKVYLIVCAN